jgi:hypothetical protein
MPRVLTWNLHHANHLANPVGQQTPMQRLAHIAQLALVNAVDLVCLQEVRRADLNVGGVAPGVAGQVALPPVLPAPASNVATAAPESMRPAVPVCRGARLADP